MKDPFQEIPIEFITRESFDIIPIDGYEIPKNKETGKVLPECCPFHQDVFSIATNWYKNYPFCHPHCTEIFNEYRLNKEKYSNIPIKVVRQLSYTEYHISISSECEDWYKDITDYIEYNVWSFGQPNIGCHLYLDNLRVYVQHPGVEIEKEKRKKILDFIEGYYKSPDNVKNNDSKPSADLNVLHSTYQKWLKVFPFEIEVFKNLQPILEKQLPVLTGEKEYNKYLRFSKHKLHTKESLISSLVALTKHILGRVNIPSLRKQGILSDVQAVQLEFSEAKLNTAIDELTIKFSKGEMKYVKVLKKWLVEHQEFFKQNIEILKKIPAPMNYFEIVLKGYLDENNREHLPQYFYRQFKEAEKNFYSMDEFFNGCLKGAFILEQDIEKFVNDRKIKLSDNIVAVREGRVKNMNEEEGEEAINQWKQEIAETKKENFSANLFHLTKGRYTGNVYLKEIRFIQNAIEKARQKCFDQINPPESSKEEAGTANDSKLKTEKKVINAFSFMLEEDPRRHKRILNNTDFQNLISWVTHYFENGFSVPNISKPITEVNTNKGNVIFTFKNFFKKEHPEKTYPESLFELYKSIFYPYRKDKIENFIRQKEPQYYKQLINKVKKSGHLRKDVKKP